MAKRVARFKQGLEVFSVLRLLLIVPLLSLAMPAFAMTVTVEQRIPPRAGLAPERPVYTIRMTGMVERGDADALREALERAKAATTTYDPTACRLLLVLRRSVVGG
jgi:membrane-bound ClpP family serine protease